LPVISLICAILLRACPVLGGLSSHVVHTTTEHNLTHFASGCWAEPWSEKPSSGCGWAGHLPKAASAARHTRTGVSRPRPRPDTQRRWASNIQPKRSSCASSPRRFRP